MRLPGWESRLMAVIEDARTRPYVLGEHDCFRVACRVVDALTGVDRWPEFKGYTTRREGLRRIAEHGSSFVAAGEWFFGGRAQPVALARRGDIVAFHHPLDADYHLGVAMGKQFAGLCERGLAWLPLRAALCCWRVG